MAALAFSLAQDGLAVLEEEDRVRSTVCQLALKEAHKIAEGRMRTAFARAMNGK